MIVSDDKPNILYCLGRHPNAVVSHNYSWFLSANVFDFYANMGCVSVISVFNQFKDGEARSPDELVSKVLKESGSGLEAC